MYSRLLTSWLIITYFKVIVLSDYYLTICLSCTVFIYNDHTTVTINFYCNLIHLIIYIIVSSQFSDRLACNLFCHIRTIALSCNRTTRMVFHFDCFAFNELNSIKSIVFGDSLFGFQQFKI